jgi:hypothetical protein
MRVGVFLSSKNLFELGVYLFFNAAQSCEWAVEERCRCRCDGRLHGKRRGLVVSLKPKDPHYVPPELVTLAELQRFEVCLTGAVRIWGIGTTSDDNRDAFRTRQFGVDCTRRGQPVVTRVICPRLTITGDRNFSGQHHDPRIEIMGVVRI